jgi:type I restriction enzyme, S subunit
VGTATGEEQVVALGDVVSPRNDRISPRLTHLPFIGLEHVASYSGQLLGHGVTSDVRSSVGLFSKGDVLYGRLRPYLNKVIVAPFDGAASAEFIVFPGHGKKIDAGFLRYRLRSQHFLDFTAQLDRGDRPRVKWDQISQFRFELPPLTEQRCVAARLDELCARLSTIQRDIKRVQPMSSRCAEAVLTAAFAGELMPGESPRQVRSIETPRSYQQALTAPEDWALYTLGDVCKIEGGSQPAKSTFRYKPQPDYVRLIQIRDYKSDAHATYVPASLARRHCKPKDIMIARYGPPIFQILEGLEGAYNVALMKAVPNPKLIERDFLFFYLQHPTLREYVQVDAQRTAGQDGVNKRHLLQFPIFLPTKAEQLAIVHQMRTILQSVSAVTAQSKRVDALLSQLEGTAISNELRRVIR